VFKGDYDACEYIKESVIAGSIMDGEHTPSMSLSGVKNVQGVHNEIYGIFRHSRDRLRL
jgi:hypothetical protein